MRIREFRITNFRSFHHEQTIKFNQDLNVFAIFGPNGSGKTNLYLAINFFRNFIQSSTKFEGQQLNIETFALSNDNNRDTKLSAQFEDEEFVYEYGFSIKNHVVSDEYLKKRTKDENKFLTIFRRNSIISGRYSENGFTPELFKKTRVDALILTKAWEENNDEAIAIFDWLKHLQVMSGAQPITKTSKRIMEDSEFKEKVLKFLKGGDLFIQDLSVEKVKIPDEIVDSLPFKREIRDNIDREAYSITTTHFIYDGETKNVINKKLMSLNDQESNGTNRMYELAYPVIDSLDNGNILCIDEFELFLHPNECEYIINLFKKRESNPKNAQLIITTHATQIMNDMNKGSLYLFGKNATEETIVYSIPSNIRNGDHQIEKKYLNGFFGGVPRIEKI